MTKNLQDEIIKRNLFITLLTLVIFFFCSIMLTSYTTKKSLQNQVVSMSEVIESQIKSTDDYVLVVESFTTKNHLLHIIISNYDGKVIVDSDNDTESEYGYYLSRDTLDLIYEPTPESKRFYIQNNVMYFVTEMDNLDILVVGLKIENNSVLILNSLFLMLCLVIISVILNLHFTDRFTNKIMDSYAMVKTNLQLVKSGKFERVETITNYAEIDAIMDEMQEICNEISLSVNQVNNEKNKLDFIIHTMNQGVIVIGENNKIYLINKWAMNVLNIGEDSLGEIETIDEQITSKVKACLENKNDAVFDFEKPEIEKVYAFHLNYFSYPWQDLNQSIPLILVLINDVTEERKSDMLKAEFVSNASHELKTPITSIGGFSEILMMNSDKYDDTTNKYIKIIFDESNHMREIINDMLYLSALQQNVAVVNLDEDVNLYELVSKVFVENEKQINQRKINVIRNDSPDVVIEGNYRLTHHILSNLINNAIKYNKIEGSIIIDLEKNEKNVILKITDTGIGISEKNFNKIFNRFYREDESRQGEKKEGSGLGLNIVKQISEVINAKIELKSKIGEGSEFSIIFNYKN